MIAGLIREPVIMSTSPTRDDAHCDAAQARKLASAVPLSLPPVCFSAADTQTGDSARERDRQSQLARRKASVYSREVQALIQACRGGEGCHQRRGSPACWEYIGSHFCVYQATAFLIYSISCLSIDRRRGVSLIECGNSAWRFSFLDARHLYLTMLQKQCSVVL